MVTPTSSQVMMIAMQLANLLAPILLLMASIAVLSRGWRLHGWIMVITSAMYLVVGAGQAIVMLLVQLGVPYFDVRRISTLLIAAAIVHLLAAIAFGAALVWFALSVPRPSRVNPLSIDS